MDTLRDRRIDPDDIAPEIQRQLVELFEPDGDVPQPVLVRRDGTSIPLPKALNDLCLFVIQAMERKQAVVLLPEDETFTTQAAADFLGMSRPYLLRLLERGEIPFHHVGTHRRLLLRDLRAYQQERDRKRREKLDALAKAMEEAGHDGF